MERYRILDETRRLLATPRTGPTSNHEPARPQSPLPAFTIGTLRDTYGTPAAMLVAVVKLLGTHDPSTAAEASYLLCLARWWLLKEIWQPTRIVV